MKTRKSVTLCALLAVGLAAAACATHLENAKLYYTRAGEESAAMRAEQAAACFERARSEAAVASRRRPSAQAFTIKGLAEVNLGLWKEAEASFLKAFDLGHEPAQSWASDVALVGLAISFSELGLEESAGRVYAELMRRSKFRPAAMAAASRRTEAVLKNSLGLPEKERKKALAGLLGELDSLVLGDYACGLYHYLISQVCGHTGDYERAYQEAVIARELGLPSEKAMRDNDNQIVFCYERLAASADEAAQGRLLDRHRAWVKKWGWRDERTPAWKKG
jgi:tetratricopeptide (TPR) repeat protein